MREYIGDKISIDGRMIGYRVVNAQDYFTEIEGMTDKEVYEWLENADNEYVYELVNRIMALKQSIWLLRRTSHSCGSLSESLYHQELEIIHELRSVYNFDFKDDVVEEGINC